MRSWYCRANPEYTSADQAHIQQCFLTQCNNVSFSDCCIVLVLLSTVVGMLNSEELKRGALVKKQALLIFVQKYNIYTLLIIPDMWCQYWWMSVLFSITNITKVFYSNLLKIIWNKRCFSSVQSSLRNKDSFTNWRHICITCIVFSVIFTKTCYYLSSKNDPQAEISILTGTQCNTLCLFIIFCNKHAGSIKF